MEPFKITDFLGDATVDAGTSTVINVRDAPYGARGGQDCTAAFQAAFAAAQAGTGRAVIYIPGDDLPYILSAPMPAFVGKPVRVYGDGVLATTLAVNYVGATPFMCWQPLPGQSTINFVQADNFRVESTSAITILRVIGTSFGSYFHHIHIQALHADAIAVDQQGWDQTSWSDCFIQAGRPFYFAKVTQGASIGAGQCDAFSFTNMRVWTYGDAHPLFEWENGASFTRSVMDGDQTWLGGTAGIKFISTGAFNGVSISGQHWEGSGGVPFLQGFMYDIQPGMPSADVTFRNCSGGSTGAQGWRIRNLQRVTWIDSTFEGAWAAPFTQLDADNTCDKLTFINFALANAANAVRSIGSQLRSTRTSLESPTPGWYFDAYLEKPDASADLNNCYVAGARESKTIIESLAAGASVAIASPGHLDATAGVAHGLTRVFVGAEHATGADATLEYGLFVSVVFGIALIPGTGSGNIATADTPGKLCVIYPGGVFPLTIKNNLAVPLRVRVVID